MNGDKLSSKEETPESEYLICYYVTNVLHHFTIYINLIIIINLKVPLIV